MRAEPGFASGDPGAHLLLAACLSQGEGARLEVGGDTPLLLSGSAVWLVESGQVDVFYVRVQDGLPVGHRRHVFRVAAGGALFGLDDPDGGGGLLAVPLAGTRLLRTSRQVLAQLLVRAEFAAPARALIDGWVEGLCAGMAPDAPPPRCEELESGQELALPDRASVRSRRQVCWLRHLEGHSWLFGSEGLEVNGTGLTPLSARAWLEIREPSRLLLLETGALAEAETLWDGLRRLHALALRQVLATLLQDEAADRERMSRRTSLRHTLLADACGALAASMAPEALVGATLGDPTAGNQDRLLAACRLVGSALGVPIRPDPRGGDGAARRDPLGALLKASRIRARRVVLRDDWWRHEHGPLLAYLEGTKAPVALLPGPEGYLLRDPTEANGVCVTAAVAETLAPFAYTFYRGFRDASLGVADVLRFGLRDCRRDLLLVPTIGLGTTLLGMVPALATGVLFNEVIPQAQRSQVLQLTIVLLACAVATGLFGLANGIAMLRIEGRMGSVIQSAVWDRLLSLPLSFFRPYSAGDLAVRAMSIDAMRQVVSASMVAAMMSGLFSLGNLALMYYYSVSMALKATLLIGVLLLITLAGSWAQLGPQRQATRLQARSSGLVLQLLSAIGKLRVAGAEAPAFALWAQRFSEQRRLQVEARSVANWVSAAHAAFPVAAFVWIFVAALPLVTEQHALGTGDLLAFMAAFSACTAALVGTCGALVTALDVVPLYEQAQPILEALPEVDAAKSDPGTLSGDIEVQHAVFRYQQDSPLVLREVSFRIRPGQFVAFVGPSGSGKSTLLRLLLGFETLESGAIYFDNQELGGLDVQAVRRQMGVVLQSGRLMSGDIFTNIVGSAPASLEEAWEAARMAGLADDVRSMPMGMHTVVSEGGGTLSGGQRQRLMIARAIVHRPRILLFDEATSALDNRTQALVSASLERLQATRIVVAHRLSTVLNADQILVLEGGRIVQSGTYEELMRQPGLFAELASRQVV